MNIQELKVINENKLNSYLQLKDKDNSEQLVKEIDIHTRIKKLLDNNESLFFQISMDDALKILSKLIPKENLKEVYTELISGESFKDLRKRFKL